jgi:hypothetical protein
VRGLEVIREQGEADEQAEKVDGLRPPVSQVGAEIELGESDLRCQNQCEPRERDLEGSLVQDYDPIRTAPNKMEGKGILRTSGPVGSGGHAQSLYGPAPYPRPDGPGTGTEKPKVVPAWLLAQIWPPCASTIRLAI